ncbi:hypothetical protein Smp_144900 [Schistosoma mansoni]|uniref:hypothetical protein n=1 Tax=Schistosoma mansoni TaxID=6183 RepID=UPI0001A63D70|nr:hypothetical protein Smp_144900 [Schistosoma mansoni]|eukprot:XP_018652254.1 hypothetical protein Smp_144900 [Schistosoma mansoni]
MARRTDCNPCELNVQLVGMKKVEEKRSRAKNKKWLIKPLSQWKSSRQFSDYTRLSFDIASTNRNVDATYTLETVRNVGCIIDVLTSYMNLTFEKRVSDNQLNE